MKNRPELHIVEPQEEAPVLDFGYNRRPDSLIVAFGRTLVKATAWAIPFTAGAWFIADEVVRQPVKDELGQTRRQVNATLLQESDGLNSTLLSQAESLDTKIDDALVNIEEAQEDVSDIRVSVEAFMLQFGFVIDENGELAPTPTTIGE